MSFILHRNLLRPGIRHVEPSGASHLKLALEIITGVEDDESRAEKSFAAPSSAVATGALEADDLLELNLYERLGLHRLGDGVGDADIKTAHLKALKVYHPDKTGKGEDDEAFLGIQEAFATLTDLTKRRAYDSQNEFDDSLPTGREKLEDFYKVYGSLFKANGRFAVKTPVPELGDDETPMEKVDAFYKYWSTFESWRDFSLAKGAQEHDIDSAQSREHKRWMIKENMKGVKNMKKKEIQRVAKLVDMAIARDPRLKRAATAAKEKKDAAKNARKAALEKEKNDRLAAAAAAEARANARAAEEAAAAKNLKAAREAKKKAIRRLRSTLRKLAVQGAAVIAKSTASPLPQTISEADVDLICEHAAAQEGDEGPAGSTDDIGSLSGIAALEALQAVFGELQRGEGGSVAARAEDDLLRGCAALARRLSVAQGESSDEAAAAAAAREANHAKAAAEAEATAVAAKLAKDVEWTADEMSMLAKAAKKYPGGGAGRWLAIANYINQQLKLKVPKTKENCLAKYQRIQQNLTSGGGAAVKTTGGASSGASVETGRGSAAGSGGAEALQDPDAAPWSALQQRQLETALGKFPSSMDKNERWKAIAATVDGKNKKDCIVRFKFLREQVKLRKGNT